MVLWIGITLIVLMGIFPPASKTIWSGGDYKVLNYYAVLLDIRSEDIEYGKLLIQWSIVGAITGDLFVTLKDKEPKDKPNNK